MLFAHLARGYRASMVQAVQPREWRRFGFSGPPEPWAHDAQHDLERLATSYYVEVLEARRQLRESADTTLRSSVEELFMTATRHKHEIDYTLRHWATPVERARVEDRLGSLMRVGMRLREIRETAVTAPSPEPLPAA
jgi:hypothetical protein